MARAAVSLSSLHVLLFFGRGRPDKSLCTVVSSLYLTRAPCEYTGVAGTPPPPVAQCGREKVMVGTLDNVANLSEIASWAFVYPPP